MIRRTNCVFSEEPFGHPDFAMLAGRVFDPLLERKGRRPSHERSQGFRLLQRTVAPRGDFVGGSAGTGKTYALARIFLRLVAEEGVEVGKILTVTFTTAATEELRERIRDLLVEAQETLQEDPEPEERILLSRLRNEEEVKVSKEECIRRIKLAITCFDEAIISTIHGFLQPGAFGKCLGDGILVRGGTRSGIR